MINEQTLFAIHSNCQWFLVTDSLVIFAVNYSFIDIANDEFSVGAT